MPEERGHSLEAVIALAKAAGTAILKYYGLPSEDKTLRITQKQDHTLLTQADLNAHNVLYQGLKKMTPDIPILSEEGEIMPYTQRTQWLRYWLLDPLDGTRGFIAHSEEFTVNIALIENRRPILGVVYAPKLESCYFAAHRLGAFKQMQSHAAEPIHTRKMDWDSFRVLMGHYLSSSRLPELLETVEGCEVVRLNSSLKFCAIAEGKGDFYPRFGETSEWDTAG